MNRFERSRAIDELATRDPEHLGYGYADSQHAWHHDPAIEQGRTSWHEWLELVSTTTQRATIVQIGLGRRGGGHLALLTVAARVVTVEIDAVRVAALRSTAGFDAERSVLIAGDSANAEVAAAVRRAAPVCDVLLLDGGCTYEHMRSDWERYAPLVRDGGLVALVDRSQVQANDRRRFDVDRLILDLERDVLQPCGVRWRRHGNAHAIHTYVQTAAVRAEGKSLAWPPGFCRTGVPQGLGESAGFSLWAGQDRVVAVPTATGTFCARALHRNEYAVVLTAADEPALRALVLAWTIVAPRLAQARRLLRTDCVAAAAAAVAAVRSEYPSLRAWLIACVEQAPWNRALLLALGTLSLFGDAPREGALLLRRALQLELLDAELMQTVAAAFLQVLGDEAGARALLAAAKQHLRGRKIAQVCHTTLRGHVLWDYPQLLTSVHGVLEVGAHRGEHIAAWSQLELKDQCYVEANPTAFAELERTCREARFGRTLAVAAAVGATSCVRTLHCGASTAHASFLRTHAQAPRSSTEQQTHAVEVPVTTLDELVAAGRIEPRRYNLLFVDTNGTELDVLRGAGELLRHVDIVCVAVFLQPVYEGAPMPQEIQAFLRELHDGDGFGLRAFEPSADARRGSAVFRRLKVRGVMP